MINMITLLTFVHWIGCINAINDQHDHITDISTDEGPTMVQWVIHNILKVPLNQINQSTGKSYNINVQPS